MSFYTINIILNVSDELNKTQTSDFMIESLQDEYQNVLFTVNIDKHSFDCVNCNQKYVLNLVNGGHDDDDEFKIKEELDEKVESLEELEPLVNILECVNAEKGRKRSKERLKNIKRKRFTCEKCKKVFAYKKTLKNHYCLGWQLPDFHCKICDASFPEEERLREHLYSTHKLETPKEYICHLCGAQFTKNYRLKYHLKRSNVHQTQPKPVKVLCDPLYECHYCSKKFLSKYTISRHIKRHFPSLKKTPSSPIKCHICGQLFKEAKNLKRHIKIIHEGQKPYQCHLCSKQFTSGNYLKIHIGHHEGTIKYPCKFCHLTYRDPGTVAGHMRKFHSEQYTEYKQNKKLLVCE